MTLVQVVLEGRTLSSMALGDWSPILLLGALWILQQMDSIRDDSGRNEAHLWKAPCPGPQKPWSQPPTPGRLMPFDL